MQIDKDLKNMVHISVRQTPIYLIVDLFILEFIIIGLNVLIGFLLDYLHTQLNYSFPFTRTLIIISIAIQIVNLILITLRVLSWINKYYIFTPEEIIIHTGILNTRKTEYKLEQLETVVIEQSLWGKIFNYGTLRIYNPILKGDVYITSVPEPEKYLEILRKFEKGERIALLPKREETIQPKHK
jgi:uncharacterized membrane protein YdbT with pleckstrin-like domain